MSSASHGERQRYDVAFYVPLVGSLLAPGNRLPPGGAETQAFLLARALANRGWRVCMVAYEPGGGLPDSVEGVDIVGRPPPRWRAISGPRGKFAEIATIWRTVGSIDADVFVQRGTGIDTGLVALSARARRRAFVYSSANVIDFDYGRVDRRRTVLLFNTGVRLSNEVVVQSMEQAELCRRRFGRSAVVIRSIAEPVESRARSPEAFLWVGKLTSWKRPLEFIELARSVPEARFRLVGVASEKDSHEIAPQVERAAAATPNLDLLPARARGELSLLYDAAVAVVNTSEYEGMPNVFLEGWSRGIPALALSHDPDGVIERHQLGGFARGSGERLAELARELWRDRGNRSEIASRCRDYVLREHSPDAVAEHWMETLRGCGSSGAQAGGTRAEARARAA